MAITVSESEELTPDDLTLVRRWGGPRQLGAELRGVVLVGRLQRAIVRGSRELADAEGLLVDGRGGPRTRKAYERFNLAFPENAITLGPELTARVADMPATVPDAAAITADLPEDPAEGQATDGSGPNRARRHHHHRQHGLPVPCEADGETGARRDSSSLGSERTDGDEALPLPPEREPDL